MSDQKKDQDKLLDSDYDGIQEYDNDLPKWWVYLFYLTVIFAPLYIIYFHVYPGVDPQELLASDMSALKEKQSVAEQANASKELGEDDLLKLTSDGGAMAKGKDVFVLRCAPCHGQLGEGLVGPNLTDHYWIHGGKITDVRHTVEVGVLDKGMVPWKGVLPSEEINSVVAYVWSLQGTNPPNAKPPQGNLVE